MWMEKLGDGQFKYIERYKHPHTEKYRKVSITLTKDTAQAWKQASKKLNEKIDDKLKKLDQNDITFGEVVEKWWKVYPQTVKRTSSLRNQWNLKIIRKHITDDYIIRTIHTEYIQELIEDVYYQDSYSFSTTRQVRSLLNIIFAYAKNNKYISENPVTDTKIVKKTITYDQLEKIENKFLEKEELTALLNELRSTGTGKRYGDMAEFLALTGLRVGECLALTNENVFEDYIEIDGTLDYQTRKSKDMVKETTKTAGSTRKVMLTDRLKDIISELNTENNHMNKNLPYYTEKGCIFSSYYGNPIAIRNFNNAIQKAAANCKIQKDVTSHIMRHTHISILSELGLPLKTIMDRVGHQRAETTLQIYSHVTKNMHKELVDKLNNFHF